MLLLHVPNFVKITSISNDFKSSHLVLYCIYESVNWVNISSGNGLPTVCCQAIMRANADLQVDVNFDP